MTSCDFTSDIRVKNSHKYHEEMENWIKIMANLEFQSAFDFVNLQEASWSAELWCSLGENSLHVTKGYPWRVSCFYSDLTLCESALCGCFESILINTWEIFSIKLVKYDMLIYSFYVEDRPCCSHSWNKKQKGLWHAESWDSNVDNFPFHPYAFLIPYQSSMCQVKGFFELISFNYLYPGKGSPAEWE